MNANVYGPEIIGNTELKYPKSKHGYQCLGPCFPPGATTVHPISLEHITNNHNPFCPIKLIDTINPLTQRHEIKSHDECFQASVSKDYFNKSEYERNIVMPVMDFSEEYFLKTIYNINSFDKALEYISKKKTLPKLTRLRILDCAWVAYGQDVIIIDNRLVDFYIELIKKYWINDIYNKIGAYVHVKKNTIFLDSPDTNELTIKDYSTERINFILNRFINYDEIYKFLTRFIKNRSDNEKISELIKNDLLEYIINKIKLTIEK